MSRILVPVAGQNCYIRPRPALGLSNWAGAREMLMLYQAYVATGMLTAANYALWSLSDTTGVTLDALALTDGYAAPGGVLSSAAWDAQELSAHPGGVAGWGYAALINEGDIIVSSGARTGGCLATRFKASMADLIAGTPTWTAWGATYLNGLWSQTAQVEHNGVVYNLWGYNNAAAVRTSIKTPLSSYLLQTAVAADWTAGFALPSGYTARLAAAIIIDEYVYIHLGYYGSTTPTYTSGIYKLLLTSLAAGTGSLTAVASGIPAAMIGIQLLRVGDYVYVLGGSNATTGWSVAYRKPVANFTAGTGSWVAWVPLPGSVYRYGNAFTYDGRVYLFGGGTGVSTAYAPVTALHSMSISRFVCLNGTVTATPVAIGTSATKLRVLIWAENTAGVTAPTFGSSGDLLVELTTDNGATWTSVDSTLNNPVQLYAASGIYGLTGTDVTVNLSAGALVGARVTVREVSSSDATIRPIRVHGLCVQWHN